MKRETKVNAGESFLRRVMREGITYDMSVNKFRQWLIEKGYSEKMRTNLLLEYMEMREATKKKS